jgi:hypothetical protein
MEASGYIHVQAVLPLDKYPPLSIEWEVRWAPETVWMLGVEKNLLSLL